MRKLISEDSFQQDLELLLKRSKNVPKKPSALKRDLDARKNSEAYRALFCLPATEKLDGKGRAGDLLSFVPASVGVGLVIYL
jgi:hypothetical protein